MSKQINRRRFLTTASGAAAATVLGTSTFPTPAIAQGLREWIMVSTFPKGSPGLQRSGERVARTIESLSDGRIKIKSYGAGEFVPAFETFDAVRENKAQVGNSMPYFWTGKDRRAAFFSAVPSGLIAEEQMGWIYHGGGQALWDELYAGYGLKGFMAGIFGSQQAGWFTKEINSLNDLQGVKMRIPGLAGEVMDRVGASAMQLPLGEVMSALQSGTLDASEFLGGWVDLAFGFPEVAKNYYGPGFHEPGSGQELMLNLEEWNKLPKDLQEIVRHACQSETAYHAGLFAYNQSMALRKITREYGVKVRPFPDDVLEAIFRESEALTAEIGEADDLARRIYQSWSDYRSTRIEFSDVQTEGFLRWRRWAANNA